ncbi:exocyst complex component 6B isoform X1 [Lates japonicus]|uniref:Exocyst complex component 6B isoform X1 n=1 Tax=Lates japonicus TaxID=270547 RepID=A0AAD3NJ50_LATJO|nr:exocyst complex component 6B isoform X1 [Lates japonicus]
MTYGAQPVRSAQLGSAQHSSEPSTATCRMASIETAAEHERILREIESTDTNCIGPTLRSSSSVVQVELAAAFLPGE